VADRRRCSSSFKNRFSVVIIITHRYPMPTGRSRVTGDPPHRNRQRAVIIQHSSATPQNRHRGAAAPSSFRSRKSSASAQQRSRIVSVNPHPFSRHRPIVVQDNPA
jgi:hypothetical protein